MFEKLISRPNLSTYAFTIKHRQQLSIAGQFGQRRPTATFRKRRQLLRAPYAQFVKAQFFDFLPVWHGVSWRLFTHISQLLIILPLAQVSVAERRSPLTRGTYSTTAREQPPSGISDIPLAPGVIMSLRQC